jgi:hypothetical protein
MGRLRVSNVTVFLASLSACIPLLATAQNEQRPSINERFPIEGHLSPPIVGAVEACSTHVYVSGFVPHATVRVYKNGATLIATVTPTFGFTTVTVAALASGDKLTATQTVLGETSAPTDPPTVVGNAPTSLGAPVIDPTIYTCGRVVPVQGLASGVTVDVKDVEAAASIGSGYTPNDWGSDWTPAFTTPLVLPHHVTATQASCSPLVSAPSSPVAVRPEPSPLVAPSLDPPVVGNDAVTAHGLYTGALLEIFDGATPIGSGYATGSTNWVALAGPLTATSSITARQSLCGHSPPSKPVRPVTTLPAPIVLGPICPKAHVATVRGTTINAIVVLMRNGQIIGYGGAAPGDVTLAFAPPRVAANGDVITAVQYIGGVISPTSNEVHVNCFPQNVVTQHNDNARRGGQLAETILTPANVAGRAFGLLYDRAVKGTIMAQPLYVHGVKVRSVRGRPVFKNLVFIATSEDVVYAFDADDTSADVVSGGESTKAVWRTVIGTPHVGDICAETDPPVVGITSTPVIDVVAGRMYVVARDQRGDGGMGVDVLHALDIATGADLRHVIVTANATIGKMTVAFQPACQRQRPGLLLQNGNVYLGYGTYSCDAGCPDSPYRGWVIGFRASDFAPAGAFTNSLAPAEGGMGVWASGNGLAGSDDGTAIFYETGNDIGGSGLLANGDAFIKLTSAPTALSFAARFQPANANDLRVGDTDLGSGGPMLLPGGKLVGGGKDGAFYVLPQSNLTTGATSFQAFYNSFHYGPAPYPYNSPPVYATECPLDDPVGHVANQDQHCWINPSLYPAGESYGPNIHGGPVYWGTDATHGLVYKMAEKDYLKAFAYDVSSGTLNPVPAAVAPVRPGHDGMPGGFSSVSASGAANGIVWTVVQQADGQWGPATPAILYAFDARTLAVLWSNAGEDEAAFAKFNSPTIADGRVFLPSVGHFQVYGLHRRVPPWLHKDLRGLSLAAAIRRRWLFTGAAAGTLGEPLGKLQRDAAPGRHDAGAHMDFVQDVVGGGYGNISLPPDVRVVIPMCSEPETQQAMRIVSTVYASPKTGARIVRGEIRRVFLAQGGVRRFGFPLTDEVPTPDGFGLMTRFENGTLVWYPGKEVAITIGAR